MNDIDATNESAEQWERLAEWVELIAALEDRLPERDEVLS